MANKPKKLTAKARAALERQFLSAVISRLKDEDDIRDFAARYGINWRRFRDKRHRAIWRAVETLNLGTVDGRMDILEKEFEGEKGERGSAAWKIYIGKLIERSAGAAWLERELAEAGAISAAGGKKYFRDLVEIHGGPGGAIMVFEIDNIAKELGFM